MARRLGLLIVGLLVLGGAMPANAGPDAAAAEIVRGSARAGFERPADVPWLLIAGLLVAAILTLQAGLRSQPRAVRVSIRPPKQR
ncbi:MAG TPA: hypothetical protein VM841_15345 [Actinomycetota bacterium]|nr:hypothetical protein [Actinomycetota bacterium]